MKPMGTYLIISHYIAYMISCVPFTVPSSNTDISDRSMIKETLHLEYPRSLKHTYVHRCFKAISVFSEVHGWLSKIWSHFGVPIILRHLLFRVPKKGP